MGADVMADGLPPGFVLDELPSGFVLDPMPESPQQAAPQASMADALVGALNVPLQGATFNFSDEIAGRGAAGVSSLMDALRGNIGVMDIPNTYSERVEPAVDYIRAQTEAVRNAAPVTSAVGDIMGAVTSAPAKVVQYGGKALGSIPYVGKALGYGGAGATSGGLYGFGGGEDGAVNRAEEAAQSAAIGYGADSIVHGAGDLLKAGGKAFSNQADSLRASAVGISKADRAKAVKPLREAIKFQQTGRDATDRALDIAEKYKILDDVDPVKIMQRNVTTMKGLADDANNIIREADTVQDKLVPAPKLDDLEAWVKSRASTTERKKLLGILEEEIDGIKGEFDGTFSSLQNIKQNLGSRAYATESTTKEKALYRRITRTLKEHLEKQVGALENQGKLGKGTLKQLQTLNDDFSQLTDFEELFVRNAAKEHGNDFVKDNLIPLLKTTGGVGVPLLATAYTGDPTYAALGIGGYAAMTPQGRRMLSNAAKAGVAEKPGDFLVNNRERLANIINSSGN